MTEAVSVPAAPRAGVRPDVVPASDAQQRLWFVDRLDGGIQAGYHMLLARHLRGPLDIPALEQALHALVARHEVLRTRFAEADGEAIQIVDPLPCVRLAVEDRRGMDPAGHRTLVDELLARALAEPFDLAAGPLLRVWLLRLTDQHAVFVRAAHHIVCDGWSEGIFLRELFHLYDAQVAGQASTLPPLAVQYADYALWQRQQARAARASGALARWTAGLAGMPERLALRTDRLRPSMPSIDPAGHEVRLPADELAALKAMSRAHQASLFMALLATWAVLLARVTGQHDLVIGVPHDGRQSPATRGLIGLFVNMLVLRVRVRLAQPFAEVLHDARRVVLDALQHRDIPFQHLVEALAPQQRLEGTPLVQAAFDFQAAPRDGARPATLAVEPVASEPITLRMDLELHARERDGTLSMLWVYNRQLFDGWRIEQLARQYRRLLAGVAADPSMPVGDVDLLDAEQRRRLLDAGRAWHAAS